MIKWVKDTTIRFGSSIVIGDNMRLDEDADGRVKLSSVTGAGSVSILDDLTDVTIAAVADRHILVYNAGASQWQNLTLTAADIGAGTFKTGSFVYQGAVRLNGVLDWASDNASDIGAVGASRPRTGYFGTKVVAPIHIAGIDDTPPISLATYEVAVHDDVSQGGLFVGNAGINIGTRSNHSLHFISNNAIRWVLSGSGHLLATTDNTFDIGTLTDKRPRNIYAVNTFLGGWPDGTNSATLSVWGNVIVSGSVGWIKQVGAGIVRIENTGSALATGSVGNGLELAGNTALPSPALVQVFNRSTGAFAGLSLRGLQIDIYTSSLIWKFTSAGLIANTDNGPDIGALGATRPRTGYFATSLFTPALYSEGATSLILGTNSTSRWTIGSGGNLFANVDNVYDIGALSTNRVRGGYFRTTLNVGDISGFPIPVDFNVAGGSLFSGTGFAYYGNYPVRFENTTQAPSPPYSTGGGLEISGNPAPGSTGSLIYSIHRQGGFAWPLLIRASGIDFYTGWGSNAIRFTLRDTVATLSAGVDLVINAAGLGRFDNLNAGAGAPLTDHLLSYGSGGKWISRFVQTTFNTGNVTSAGLIDGTTISVIDDQRTLSGSPAAPTSPPVVTGVYKGIIVDMSSYGALPAGAKFVVDYSINSGSSFTTDAIIGIGNRIVHSNLHPEWGYVYKFKLRGASDSAYSSSAASKNPSYQAEVNAFGLITASQISTINLSAISANIGTITAGIIQNQSGTAGIRVDIGSNLPSTWTTYLNLPAITSGTFLKVLTALSISANGNAVFSGSMRASSLITASILNYGNTILSGTFSGWKARLAYNNIDWTNTTTKRISYGEDNTDSLVMYDATGQNVENIRMGDYTLTAGSINFSDSTWTPTSDSVTLDGDGILSGTAPPINTLTGTLPALNNQFVVKYFQELDNREVVIIGGLSLIYGYVDLYYSTNAGVSWTFLLRHTLSEFLDVGTTGTYQSAQWTETVTAGSGAGSMQFKTVVIPNRNDTGTVAGSSISRVTVNSVSTGNVTWTNGGTTISRRNLSISPNTVGGTNQGAHFLLRPTNVIPAATVAQQEGEVTYVSGSAHQLFYNDGSTTIGRFQPVAIEYINYWELKAHNGVINGIGVPTPTIFSGVQSVASQPENLYSSFTTGATIGNKAGFVTPGGEYAKGSQEFRAKIILRVASDITSQRIWAGFTTTTQPGNSDTPIGLVAMFRYNPANTGGRWVGVVSDGTVVSGVAIIDAGVVVASTPYLLQIRYSASNVYFSVNYGQEYPIKTNIPSPSTSLAVECSIMATSAAARSFSFSRMMCGFGTGFGT